MGLNAGGGGYEGEEGGGGENSPYVWKLPCFPFNFKHNLLWQGTGTAEHLTLLRTRDSKGGFVRPSVRRSVTLELKMQKTRSCYCVCVGV